MRTGLTAFLLFTTILFMINVHAQAVGDFGSVATGTWATATTWKQWDGSGWNTFNNVIPSTSDNVYITSGTTVTAAAAGAVCKNLTVSSGGTLVTTATSGTVNYVTPSGTVNIYGNWTQAGSNTFIAGTSVTIDNASTVTYNGTQTGFAIFTFGNLVWASTGTAGTPSSALTINGNLTISGASKIRGATTGFVGTVTHTVYGNVTINGNGVSGINLTGINAGTGSVTWEIKGGLSITNGAVSGLESSTAISPASATFNIGGDLTIASTGALQFGSNAANNGTVVVNVKGNVTNNAASGATTTGIIKKAGGGGTFTINMIGTSAQTWTGILPAAFATTVCNVVINNANGVTISSNPDPLRCTLTLTNGKFTTATALLVNSISSAALISGGNSNSFINGPLSFNYATAGTFNKVFPIGKGTAYRPITLSLSQSAATSSVYTAELFNSAAPPNDLPGTLDKVSDTHYFVISEGSGGSAFTNGVLTINYDGDDGVADATNLRIAQGSSGGGGTWIDLGGTGTATTTGSITSATAFTDLTTNTAFALANNLGGGNVLPVELSSFSANTVNGKVVLNWKTATEVNSSQFVIERILKSTQNAKVTASTWTAVGSVNASNNSNTPRTYSFTDTQVKPGTYSYRLKTVDNDGTYSYSASTEATVSLPKTFTVEQNYPNPFNPSTMIAFSLPQSMKVSLVVFNTIGQEVARLIDETLDAGYYQKSFNAGNFPSGTYLYQLRAGNSVVTKKMLLIK